MSFWQIAIMLGIYFMLVTLLSDFHTSHWILLTNLWRWSLWCHHLADEETEAGEHRCLAPGHRTSLNESWEPNCFVGFPNVCSSPISGIRPFRKVPGNRADPWCFVCFSSLRARSAEILIGLDDNVSESILFNLYLQNCKILFLSLRSASFPENSERNLPR